MFLSLKIIIVQRFTWSLSDSMLLEGPEGYLMDISIWLFRLASLWYSSLSKTQENWSMWICEFEAKCVLLFSHFIRSFVTNHFFPLILKRYCTICYEISHDLFFMIGGIKLEIVVSNSIVTMPILCIIMHFRVDS